ncbi:hypothetical protein PR048_020213 [Dryococelus australis]|uniref:Uncharacterized protein n=1 Tax=Dryococelus australis TaxID=614101 RepID=A0ABQ9H5N7_9NEOP|nr:hypothetical protein PR048_020213 [Dryococelus australis]
MLAEPSTSASMGMGSGKGFLQEGSNFSETLCENSDETSTKHQDHVQLDTQFLKYPGTCPDVINDTVWQRIMPCAYKYEEFVELSKTFPEYNHIPVIGWFGVQEKQFSVFHVFCSKKTFLHLFNLAKREGFSPSKAQWRKFYNQLPAHENSAELRNYYCKWKSLQQTLLCKGIDGEPQKQITCEADKLLDVALFLASRELLGKYEDITRGHLAKVKHLQLQGKGMKGHAHYREKHERSCTLFILDELKSIYFCLQ